MFCSSSIVRDLSQEVGKWLSGYHHISLIGESLLLGNRTHTWNLEENFLPKSQESQFFQEMERTHRNFKNFYIKRVSLNFSLAYFMMLQSSINQPGAHKPKKLKGNSPYTTE